ncbi:MAG: hypothetical protein ACRD0A_10200 [Acidimicrobiales bacterium]
MSDRIVADVDVGELLPICRHCLADIELVGDDDPWWRHKVTRSRYCSRDVGDDRRAQPRIRLHQR